MAEQTLYYGGQALIEGVMIRGPHNVAVACRRPDGELAVRREAVGGVHTGALRRIPFLRGAIVLWETLALGMRALLFSSNVAMGEEEKEISRMSVVGMGLTALALVVIIEGLTRLAILLAYVGFIGLIPDIKRVYAYHGAEHKCIHALEAGDPLAPPSVQRHPTAHVRCGTSFLLMVVVVSVVVFAALGSPELWLRVVSRIALIPLIASIAYEIIRLGGRFYANPLARALMWPNLALQTLTTRQPDDAQVEVALRALREVMEADGVVVPTASGLSDGPATS